MTTEQTEPKGEFVVALTPKQIAVVALAIVAVILLRRRCRVS